MALTFKKVTKQQKTSDEIRKEAVAQAYDHRRAEDSSKYAAGWFASRVGGGIAVVGSMLSLGSGAFAAGATLFNQIDAANTMGNFALNSFAGGVVAGAAVAATALAAHGAGIAVRKGLRGIKNMQYNAARRRERKAAEAANASITHNALAEARQR